MTTINPDALRRLYAEYGGCMADSAEDILRELEKESSDRQRIVRDAVAGVSHRDIGKRLGVEGGSVRSRLLLTMRAIRNRIEFHDSGGGYRTGSTENRVPDDVRAEAAKLSAEGVSRNEISKRLGVSKASLSRWLRQDRNTQ